MAVHIPRVELLWWEGCPSTEKALAQLRDALAEVGLDEAEVHLREVQSDEQAREANFVGSPTILIDGQDAVPVSTEDEVGLTCRIYRRRDGGISPTPDPADLREALRRAAESLEVR